MCHFITLIAPTDDVAALDTLMREHGRCARPVDNPSVAKVLHPGEAQFLTTRGHCDCGTVLGGAYAPARATDPDHEAAKLARKGWSPAKIERALAEKHRAAARDKGHGPDSLDVWAKIITAAHEQLGLREVGLLVHGYSGDQRTEAFTLTRAPAPKGVALAEALAAMHEDELLVFSAP